MPLGFTQAKDGQGFVPKGLATIAQRFNACHYPQVQRSISRETNADGRQIHIPATSRNALKPRRGGLFITTNTLRLFFLFFGGAAFARTIQAKLSASTTLYARKCSSRRAAEKQKERVRFTSYPINRPPLRGLGCKQTVVNLIRVRQTCG